MTPDFVTVAPRGSGGLDSSLRGNDGGYVADGASRQLEDHLGPVVWPLKGVTPSPKMHPFTLARKPEPEVMDAEGEVEAYASADAQAYLNALDDAFIDQIAALGIDEGTALDVGTGPGSIPMKLSQRVPGLRVIGVDRSHNMLRVAEAAAARAGLGARVAFLLADASRLCFPDHTFDLIISNSLLHHLSHPGKALDEIARMARPRGKVLLRDLSRPSRLAFSIHAAWYGRHYSGRMKRLYEDSLRAAYTPAEIRSLLDASPLRTARVIRYDRTHFAVLWENNSFGLRSA